MTTEAFPSRPHWIPSPRQQARDRYRHRRTLRSAGISALSTVVIVALVGWFLVSSPGWDRVVSSFFNVTIGWESVGVVFQGLLLNLRLTAVCAVFIVVIGLLLALARTARGPVFFPLRAFAIGYVDLFRGLPLILVLLLVGFGLPGLQLQGIPKSPVVLGGIALVLSYSAYIAEVFRAGIESVHPSQRMAARSLGLTQGQVARKVVLPQAFRRVTPPLLNDLLSLIKDSGLISILGAIDAVRAAQIATARSANFTPYVVAGIMFVLITIPLARVVDWYSRRRGWVAGAGASGSGGMI